MLLPLIGILEIILPILLLLLPLIYFNRKSISEKKESNLKEKQTKSSGKTNHN